MTRARWWSMYLLSCGIGYALAGFLLAFGWRFTRPVPELITRTARGHAEDAAHKVGPYYAPVTALAIVFGSIVAMCVLVRVLS